jgi:mannose-1-phosphate guanylyltransferase
MRALLLSAGKATRLGALSVSTPKCLHEVGGEVLLDRVIRQLQAVGVTEFLINTHHLANQIVRHVSQRSDRDAFTIVFEQELLGTLGTLRAQSDFFQGESGWVLHSDNFIEGTLTALHADFVARPDDVWGSMLTFECLDPSSYGVVITDDRNIVLEFHEKADSPPSTQASAATFVFSPEVIDIANRLPLGRTDLSHDLVPRLLGHIRAVRHAGGVIDIGTLEGLLGARRLATGSVGYDVDGLSRGRDQPSPQEWKPTNLGPGMEPS